MAPSLDNAKLREMLRRMLVMRRFEERVTQMRESGEFSGHTHVYIGQEAVALGLCATLREDDYLCTTHRNHGHLLARGADPKPLLAEILGRATGYCKGKGGSFHVLAAQLGFLSASGVVAGAIPTATGAALAAQIRSTKQVAVSLFGDGALNEGAFHEAANLGSLWRVPVIYLCENNDAIPYNAANSGMAARELVDVAVAYNLPSVVVDGTDFFRVYDALYPAVERAREGGGPTFVEARTYRWPGSRGPWPRMVTGETDLRRAWGELPRENYAEWDHHDPLLIFARQLTDRGVLSKADALDMDGQARQVIDEAHTFALQSPYPSPESALEEVFA